MEEKKDEKKLKTRTGSGYLRQMYSTARNSATNNASNFRSTTTFLVNFVPVENIDASELQVRSHFDDAEIQALAQSIKMHGVLQPVLLVQNGDRYKVIAGERRLRASKLAGLERIPARVINSDDKAVHEIALRENLDRVDLHPLEEGEGYVSLLEAQSYTSYDAIAKAFGKPKSRVTECIGYTRLPETTKEALLRYGIKQRAVLRKLLETPPEEHMALIEAASKAEEEGVLLTPPTPKSSEIEATPAKDEKAKPEIKPFEYKCSDKMLAVPGFRWKVGEGPTRLDDYVAKIEKLLAEAKELATKTRS